MDTQTTTDVKFMIVSSSRTDRFKSKDCEWSLDVSEPYPDFESMKDAIASMLKQVRSQNCHTPAGWKEIPSVRISYYGKTSWRGFAIEDNSLWDNAQGILDDLAEVQKGDYGILNKYMIVRMHTTTTTSNHQQKNSETTESPTKKRKLLDNETN